jgi:hypothetical protein
MAAHFDYRAHRVTVVWAVPANEQVVVQHPVAGEDRLAALDSMMLAAP